jgi:hypothetical protein
MSTHDDSDKETGHDDDELMVSPFIPSVELKGSRTQKLRTLDTLIAYLERLRRSLAGDAIAGRTGHEGPSRYIDAPVWPWLAAGIVLGALFVLLLVAAWIRYA